MRQKPESAHYGALPSPHQLEELNTQLISFAGRHGRLRITQPKPHRRHYWIGHTANYEWPDMINDESVGCLMKQSIGAIAMRAIDEQAWDLRIFDRFEAITPDTRSVGGRAVYAFSWDETKVTMARKTTVAGPSRGLEALDEMIDHFRLDDDMLWQLTMRQQAEYLEGDDVKYLREQLNRQMVKIDSGQSPYLETRSDYLDYFVR